MGFLDLSFAVLHSYEYRMGAAQILAIAIVIGLSTAQGLAELDLKIARVSAPAHISGPNPRTAPNEERRRGTADRR